MDIGLTQDVSTSLNAMVAEEIRALLARRRVKQSQLARHLGVSEQWVSVRLRGVQPIDLNDLARIAEFLGVYPADLLPRSSEGRLITTAAPRGGTGPGTTARPTRLPERPQHPGQPSRTSPPASSRRPARTRPSNTCSAPAQPISVHR